MAPYCVRRVAIALCIGACLSLNAPRRLRATATRLSVARRAGPPTSKKPGTGWLGGAGVADARRRGVMGLLLLVAPGMGVSAGPGVQAATLQAVRIIAESEIVKPALDDRKYRLVELVESGVRCLLVSDPLQESSAAAMDVHVGHFGDPAELPGLAHFNEHMLFLGNAEYPAEDAWEKWISKVGGASNAYTDTEDTCYFFEAPSANLAEALKRWGPFFVSPRFDAAATAREVEAIESENAKNFQSDTFRVFQLTKSRADPRHPYHKFGTGNRKTLRPPDGTSEPPRDALKAFFAENYVGANMACCVTGADSNDKMQAALLSGLKGVHKKTDFSVVAEKVAAFDPLVLQEAFLVESLSSSRALNLAWPLPYRDEEQATGSMESKEEYYVAFILGHEGPNSLLASLRRQGLATSLAAGLGEETDDFRTVEVTVELTRLGIASWFQVAQAVVAEVNALGTAARAGSWPAHCLAEPLDLAKIQWKWSEPQKGGDLAQSMARKLQRFGDPSEILRSGAVPLKDPDLPSFFAEIDASYPFITLLTPQDELPIAKKGQNNNPGPRDLTEFWYGTKYTAVKLDAKKLYDGKRRALDFLFPPPNPFVVDEASVVPKNPRKRANGFRNAPPSVIKTPSRGSTKVWHSQDACFGMPRASVLLHLRTSAAADTALSATHARIWRSLLVDGLRDADFTDFGAYDAGLCGLDWGVSFGSRGLTLAFSGYDAALPEFLPRAATAMRSLDVGAYARRKKGSQTNFEALLDALTRELDRERTQQPSTRAVQELALLTERPKYSIKDQREALKQVTMASLGEWVKTAWSGQRVDVLCSGNLRQDEAEKIAERAIALLRYETNFDAAYVPPAVLAVPLKTNGFFLKRSAAKSDAETNYASLLTFQTGSGIQQRALTLVLASIGESDFYETLRTQKQLGYIVQSNARAREDVSSLVFLVQSGRQDATCTSPRDLTKYIADFIQNDLAAIVAKLDEKSLRTYVEGLAKNLGERPKSLGAEIGRSWEEIVSERLDWRRREKEVEALLKVKPSDVRAFYADFVRDGGLERRPLLVEVEKGSGVITGDDPRPDFELLQPGLVLDAA